VAIQPGTTPLSDPVAIRNDVAKPAATTAPPVYVYRPGAIFPGGAKFQGNQCNDWRTLCALVKATAGISYIVTDDTNSASPGEVHIPSAGGNPYDWGSGRVILLGGIKGINSTIVNDEGSEFAASCNPPDFFSCAFINNSSTSPWTVVSMAANQIQLMSAQVGSRNGKAPVVTVTGDGEFVTITLDSTSSILNFDATTPVFRCTTNGTIQINNGVSVTTNSIDASSVLLSYLFGATSASVNQVQGSAEVDASLVIPASIALCTLSSGTKSESVDGTGLIAQFTKDWVDVPAGTPVDIPINAQFILHEGVILTIEVDVHVEKVASTDFGWFRRTNVIRYNGGTWVGVDGGDGNIPTLDKDVLAAGINDVTCTFTLNAGSLTETSVVIASPTQHIKARVCRVVTSSSFNAP
jgi:hypothetical protein